MKQIEVCHTRVDSLIKENEKLQEENKKLSERSVFDKDDRYTTKASEISFRFDKAIERVFEEFPEVSRRELAVIAYASVGLIECKIGLKARK